MDSVEILKAMAESETLTDEIIFYLNSGMWDEWDCSLPDGLKHGFSGKELQIVAQSALISAEYARNNG